MYKITTLRHADRERGRELANSGKYKEGIDYIREHTMVRGEFGTLLEARQFWRALGLNPGANYHVTGETIYRMGVVRTD